ncbi:MAG: hypothetical protein IJU05_06515, partial [Schwartzia sp.]|nr:hypothetical protein [Schwartzia sp. (in: firmicutes)]
LRFNTSYGENDQYQYNIKTAVSWMKNTDAALVDMADAMKTVVEKANQAQGTNTATDMAAIASEMLVQVQQCVSDANTQVNGRYLFSGQADLIQPYVMSNDKYERGLTKTLDDKQAEFFNDASQSGDLTQMLTLEGTSVVNGETVTETYYLNTLTGDVYTKEFVEEGYKLKVSQGQKHVKPGAVPTGDAVANIADFDKVSKHFDERGVIKDESGVGKQYSNTTAIAGVTLTFATVSQYIVTYQGDRKQFSMVKENGAAQPATDTVNAGGIDIAGSSIFDNKEAYPDGEYPGPSGSNAFNDLLTVVAMCEQDDSRWMSSDAKTLANNSFNTVNIAQTVVAARQQVYSDCEEMRATQSETILEDITNVYATDVAKLAVDLMTAQTIYNLSLSFGSRVIPPTLADYM